MVASGLRWIDKRRDARVVAGGSVLVHAHGGARGRVVDVSAGGARIELAREAPRFAVGDRISLELHLDRRDATWLHFSGLVTRARDHEIAIAFEAVPVDFADRVQDELLDAIEALAASQILLVDGDPARRELLATELRNAGCHVEETATPLEALDALGASGGVRRLIAIADSVPAAVADELRAYVADAHPNVRIVLLGGGS
ncbi:MAG TPA: PilZ domain-containing protein [Kofleriaceae bacterium]|nr:PilZ domain-containing protein [Kofleriaceae bacterium]